MADAPTPSSRTPRRPAPARADAQDEPRLPLGMSRTNRMLVLAGTLLVLVLILRTCA
ncbi:hypothetical protein L6R53_10945 [Myxococcota bacterium]|nr:hypothetical protein [Myxococcota bacterium]